MRWARSIAQAAVASAALILALSGSAEGATFHGSWVDRALNLQYQLAGDVGLRNAPFIGTHNSFNSVAEMGVTTSTSDPNQQLSIGDQLNLDVRAIELDVHWTVTPSTGQLAPVVCHAFPNHFPCTTEKTLGQVLDEIDGWLREPANSDQVLFLYLEDHLDDQTGYDAAAATIAAEAGRRPLRAFGGTRLPAASARADAEPDPGRRQARDHRRQQPLRSRLRLALAGLRLAGPPGDAADDVQRLPRLRHRLHPRPIRFDPDPVLRGRQALAVRQPPDHAAGGG